MGIDLVVDETVPRDELPSEQQLTEAIVAACKATGFDGPVDICVRFSSDAAMRDANKQWRGKDEVTDVLSFPMQESPCCAGESLGDIMVAWPRFCHDAIELGIPPRAHACHLAIHGALHLLGYTHDDDSDAKRMQACERQAMRNIGLYDPYDDE